MTTAEPQSLRDAFLRVCNQDEFKKYNTILAEELEPFFPNGTYPDILQFEEDLAQIVDLILLFSESTGSVAELGSFVMVDEIARRLLVVVDDINFDKQSFLTLGPLRRLKSRYGSTSIFVLPLSTLGIPDIRSPHALNMGNFKSLLVEAIKGREGLYKEKTSFSPNRDGHVIKFVVGLIQNYGAMTFDEIDVCLFHLGIEHDRERLNHFLQCAELAGWIISKHRGAETYYAAKDLRSAISFKLTADCPISDRDRWRSDVLDHWRANEINRFEVIRLARGLA